MSAPILASIGTTHPWNIAGVGLDAHVAAEYRVAHVMAIAAVSAQDAGGVRGIHVVPPQALEAQLACLPDDVAAFRIGALVSTASVHIVASYLRERARRVPVVVDPVMAATLGGELRADESLADALRDELLTLPVIVTPNTGEAERLLGISVIGLPDQQAAGQEFVRRGARAALIKGGHLTGEPVDVLVTGAETLVLRGERLAGSMRGGGCTLAAALACELARGAELSTAATAAREYVRGKIAARTMRGGLQVAF